MNLVINYGEHSSSVIDLLLVKSNCSRPYIAGHESNYKEDVPVYICLFVYWFFWGGGLGG